MIKGCVVGPKKRVLTLRKVSYVRGTPTQETCYDENLSRAKKILDELNFDYTMIGLIYFYNKINLSLIKI